MQLPRQLPPDIPGLDTLRELALDVRWSWNHGADSLWRQLDPQLWEMTRNPWALLQTASHRKIEALLADPGFRGEIDAMVAKTHKLRDEPAWFQRTQPPGALARVAYFSLEFMLSETLPIYSGGLGNVAGDQLKAAGDLGVPVVGVGLLYQQGYFRQVIDDDGAQQALYPYNDPAQMPVTPVRGADGEWLRLEIVLPGYSVWLRAWEVRVGRIRLYLLDTNDVANFPIHRGITSELYGGGPELRLKQEIVLGIGGCRLLAALGIEADVFHLNEGHAALGVLERAHAFMARSGQPFEVALAATRAGNLFTTHTAVAAGFDRYSKELVARYLGNYAAHSLGIPLDTLLALGREDAADDSEDFNMAYLAVRGSGPINAVSRLHGEVSRTLFAPLFPRRPLLEVPIGHVTNGVHVPSWDSAASDRLWSDTCGQDRWLVDEPTGMSSCIRRLTDAALWDARTVARKQLVDSVRARLSVQVAVSGGGVDAIEAAGHGLDPNVLTLGFARRFASYKRPDLLLRDPERLIGLLNQVDRPMQLILAGKAHPADEEGRRLIRQWSQFIRRPDTRSRVVFLSDYDMRLTEQLVQGVDVWLNTPRRPWEACGTSGMKVLVNGGLNLSELDGWWAEAYTPETGWSLGDGKEHSDEASDAADATELYELLEQSVVPAFYERDDRGIPIAWVAKFRESMAALTPVYSAARAVREYTEQHYLPAAAAYRARSADNGAIAKRLIEFQNHLDERWAALRFDRLAFETIDSTYRLTAHVDLAGLDHAMVRVELFADNAGSEPIRVPMVRATPRNDHGPESPTGGSSEIYEATVGMSRAPQDYTARLLSVFDLAMVRVDEGRILWGR